MCSSLKFYNKSICKFSFESFSVNKSRRGFSIRQLEALLPEAGSRTAAASKMELFVIIVNGLKALTIITKSSILDVAAVLDPPLVTSQSVLLRLYFYIHFLV